MFGIGTFHGDLHPGNAMVDEDGYVEMPVDSGAAEVVAPMSFAPAYAVEESEASKRGVAYRAASGHRMPNMGQKKVDFVTEDGDTRRMTFQITNVTKPLASAGRITAKNHRIILDDTPGESYIENKITGHKTTLHKKGNIFVMRALIKNPPAKNHNRKNNNMDVDSVQSPGFSRQGA